MTNSPPAPAYGPDVIQAFLTALQQMTGLERRPSPPAKVYPSMLVDVFNPKTSKRVRIICPMATAESIGIAPGETKKNVRMALHVIEQLREQGAAELKIDPHSLDQPLVITEVAAVTSAVAVEADVVE